VLLWTAIAASVDWLPIDDPIAQSSERLQEPSWSHLAGTDALGRDVFARTLHGARVSMPVAAIVIATAVIIGCVIGAVAGFVGGWADAVLMRASDITLAFPAILWR
jgi:peptide/nickel transport system permease protein